MHRDLARLSGRTFDLLVVGGGIYGLTIAYDAAQRGLGVALIDRSDFGSGSSFNHLRTIHGGLRYLQHLDIARARESIRERRTLARIAPHALRPMPFVLPLYRSLLKGRLAMRAGLLVDRVVSGDRNRGVTPSLRLPAGRVLSRAAAIDRFPGLRRRGLTGAAVWHDYVTTEADRLTFSWALAASQCGAILANHVEATAPLVESGRVAGVTAEDRLGGGALEIAARLTINAAGGDVDRLLRPLGPSPAMPMLKAMNLVTRREAGDEALGGVSAAGRNLFLVPWRGRSVFGTWEGPAVSGSASDPPARATGAEVAAFIGELNEAFPALELTPADVTLVHSGIVPATIGSGGRAALARHEQLRDGTPGMLSIAGTKYTTARATAERVVTRALALLGRPAVPCHTASKPLPGGALRDASAAVAEARREYDHRLPSDTIPHLVAAYGSRYRDVLEAEGTHTGHASRISDDSPVVPAQLVWAVRHEMAMTLADAVVRRTPLGALGYPGDVAVARAAAIVAAEHGWDEERTRREAAALRAFYGI